jgi:hypothetical protein
MYYEKLKALVDGQQLMIYTLLANPRTRSTAFYHAMKSMSDIDGGVNEPFSTHDRGGIYHHFDAAQTSRSIRNFDQVCQNIYSVVEKILAVKPVARVWIHDHLYEILHHEMHDLLALSKNVVVCIRDPKRQFLSFLVRVANDKLATYRQSDLSRDDVMQLFHEKEKGTSPKELLAYVMDKNIRVSMKQIAKSLHQDEQALPPEELLILGMEAVLTYVQDEVSIMVENTQFYLDFFKQYQCHSSLNYVVVDTEMLVDGAKAPAVLKAVTDQLHGLRFSNDIIDDWSQDEKISMCWILENTQTPLDNAWNGPARTSTKFTTQHDVSGQEPLDRQAFPKAMHAILADAEKLYQRCLNMSELCS